jgi:hypothetical protein
VLNGCFAAVQPWSGGLHRRHTFLRVNNGHELVMNEVAMDKFQQLTMTVQPTCVPLDMGADLHWLRYDGFCFHPKVPKESTYIIALIADTARFVP